MALAKWEDRGYYALKVSVEKAQRQLHRLARKAVELLKEPVAGGERGGRWLSFVVTLDQEENKNRNGGVSPQHCVAPPLQF